ncbi:methyl-accepting chemotaxis protein [Anaerocolumna cellulosilytica]|uniref:Methyl-accepting chemotaxis protein n=1 Tax=Anaerocolumna cellulosilytica TaxID=433286 RepID=A0A6S6QZP5_9FIRM|nr:methyl-accepting chemotaxis protein [Anaerocolumna cellulosilytica]MBB5194383.1 methyl-accepting chemotaxis protein [Anaerocolumna cellulosilytica]BCJ93327.1 methyl-accepting chemotaxis protein [Anaerocolumna cellulosilytica]
MKKIRGKKAEKSRIIGTKTKLISIVIPISVVLIIALLAVTFQVSKGIILNYGNRVVKSISAANANEIKTWSQDIISTLNQVKNTVEQVELDDTQTINYLASTMNKNNSFPLGVYIGTDRGEVLNAFDFVPPADYVVTDREWFKEGVKREEFAFGAAYVDANTGEFVLSASAKVKSIDGVNKVAAADIFLSEVSNMVMNMKLMETGTILLIDGKQNTIIAHKDKSLNALKLTEDLDNGILREITKQINNENAEVFSIKDGNQSYLAYLQPVDNTDWLLASYVSSSEVLGALNELQLFISITAVISILFLMLVLERAIHIILKPVKKLTGTIEQITEGDFTVALTVKGRDEVAVMSKSLVKFINTLQTIITEVTRMTTQFNSQAEKNGKVSETLSNSAKIQSDSMHELNITVDELAKSVGQVAENASALAMVVAQTETIGKDAASQTETTVQLSVQGRDDMTRIKDAMATVEKDIKHLEMAVEEVGASTVKINDIIGLIGDIAEETNLLSLNAAIEAARAGEAGKGFAVVAQEIRKLAETSAGAVKNIAELIHGINGLVEITVDRTKESVGSIQSSSKLINNTSQTFETIYNAVDNTRHLVIEMIDRIKEVDNVATSVAAITQEQSAGAEEIVATTEELLEHAKQVIENSEMVGRDALELAVTAENLEKEMKFFRL